MWLTYDDVGLAGAGAGVTAEVALDLVSGLIEQIQVVFHWVPIVKALAQTDNTWRGGRTRLYLSGIDLLGAAIAEGCAYLGIF